MKNKTYDILKWIAMILLPALSVLYIGLGQFWKLPCVEEISGTIMLVDTFLGAILGISTTKYNSESKG